MARYTIEVLTQARVINENGEEVGSAIITGQVAVASGGSGLHQIIDDTLREVAEDTAGDVKNVFAREKRQEYRRHKEHVTP